jgi:hypothetical protein
MPSFYFEQLLQNGLNGIDQQGITGAVLQIAGVVLILSLLWAIYEAYSNGGDVRSLMEFTTSQAEWMLSKRGETASHRRGAQTPAGFLPFGTGRLEEYLRSSAV